ncbi:peptide chain release factor N(5)-glutamine methyltransferase [Dokdonella sp. MW10]|uniref:peptide chain release factor N(5)-glutamine methyltransferase n=1 Tax=Dokdonella sp. MW10 TaxID=2992926 RepID=UPI003F7D6506
MTTVADLLRGAAPPGGGEARHEAELLLAHALERSRAWLFAHADAVPDDAQRQRFQTLVAARRNGTPIAYLVGQRGFWTFDLVVTPDVLIPRADTERLVELALERIPPDAVCDVADLGTGSGAIALALASERPQARVLATDASEAALAVARGNAQRLGIGNVTFSQGDWCVPLGTRRFDVIASNPPYIEAGDVHLGEGDLRFEPAAALASGEDGLDAIRTIAAQAPRHLVPGGWLLVEHGWNQGEAVRAILSANGFADVTTAQDLESRDRVTLGRVAE